MVRMRASTFLCTVCGLLEQGGVTLPDDTHGIRERRSSSASWRYHSGVCLVCRRTKSNLQTYKCFYCVETGGKLLLLGTARATGYKLVRTATGDICDDCVGMRDSGRGCLTMFLGGLLGALWPFSDVGSTQGPLCAHVSEETGDSLLIRYQPYATGAGKYYTRYAYYKLPTVE
jgi:hypothetical protein